MNLFTLTSQVVWLLFKGCKNLSSVARAAQCRNSRSDSFPVEWTGNPRSWQCFFEDTHVVALSRLRVSAPELLECPSTPRKSGLRVRNSALGRRRVPQELWKIELKD